MTAKLARILGIFALLLLLVAPAGAQAAPRHAPNPQIPAELISQLPLGLTVDEFVNRLDGPVPHALLPYTSKPVAVIIEMSQPALAASLSATGPNSASVQRDYIGTLSQAQAPVVSAVQSFSGTVLGQYTKAYDGVLAMVPGKDLAALSALPGVKAVHDAPVSKLDLVHSVPLIRADQVWNSPQHYTGSGERIAIIDTGIDYTHAAFGGPGTAAAYASNNPAVVEPGTFPTAKVIGGYDFAGSNYDASSSDPARYTPHPDADPLDENGHGTHVASIAAGQEVDANGQVVIGAGVAKDASLYALKIFGKSGSSVLEINAIEWAMDPNGDGNIADHVDVINMSLGSSWGAASDTNPTQVAVNNAAAIGIVVVASAGNSGNSSYVTSAPAVASRAISVASSTTGYDNYPSVHSGANRIAPYVPGNPFKSPVSGILANVDAFDGTGPGDLCNPSLITPDHALQGKIALAVRGTCTFATKITNAAALGAIAVIIYNYNTPPDTLVDMDTGGTSLPAGFTLYSYGQTLTTYNNQPVTVGPDSDAFAYPIGTPDTVSTFSSRGPRGYDSALKPEITAPGDAIRAALWGSGNGAVTYGGTSMAAPHVAGVAALIRQAHPAWTPEEVKAAIMGSAVDMASDPDSYKVVPRTGAGRVDALNAVSARGLAFGDPDLVSLNWGVVEVGDNTTSYLVPQAKTIRVKNVDSAAHTYALSYEFSNLTTMKGAAFSLPASLSVPAGSTAGTGLTLTLDPTQLPVNFGGMEEYYGFIHLDSSDGGGSLRIPFYFVPRPYATLSEAPGSDHDMSYNGIKTTSIIYNQSGPTASSLAAWPLYITMPNSPMVDDMGELHLASVDYAYKDTTYGDMLSVAIANWGRLHTLQYQFNETLLLIDLKGDNNVEYGFINYQLGNYLNAASEDNRWITARINYTVSPPVIDAYSPVFIKADFNSGFQEWQIPASMMGLSKQTKFTYQIWAWDENAANATPQQVTAPVIFDYALPPYNFTFTNPAPHNSQTTLQVSVDKIFGVYDNKPKGVMVVDYNGKPGLGQAFVTPVTIKDAPVYYLPVIIK